MSTVYAIAILKVKRPGGSWSQVLGLRSASLELRGEVLRGSAATDGGGNPWGTAARSTGTWTVTGEAIPPAATTGGFADCTLACRNGERLEVEITLGDARRYSGYAYCPSAGRSGASGVHFAAGFALQGASRLWGLVGSEVAGEQEYPDAPANLAADDSSGVVILTWDKVADDPVTARSVDGYYVYYGQSPARYTRWLQVPVGDLADPDNPEYTVGGLTSGVTYYFVVTAYWED